LLKVEALGERKAVYGMADFLPTFHGGFSTHLRTHLSVPEGGRFSRTLPDVENGHFSYEKTKKSPIVWG
jgi:hypothetical protein